MAQIAGRDTKPEIAVRKLLFQQGYRYRLNVRKLPGSPDIVLSKHKKVIFVHGCFWHGHRNCPRSKRPATNITFWNRKIDANIKRDAENIKALKKTGWNTLVVWSCQVNAPQRLSRRLSRFLPLSTLHKRKQSERRYT